MSRYPPPSNFTLLATKTMRKNNINAPKFEPQRTPGSIVSIDIKDLKKRI